MSDAMNMFKLTIGDLTSGTERDAYYQNFIGQAKAQLLAADIDEGMLSDTDLGVSALVAHAVALLEKRDIANDPTLLLLRNTLSVQTKGKRHAEQS